MRKFVLIAAFVLLSATAQAGVTRGLTLASSDDPATAAQQSKVPDQAVVAPKTSDAQQPAGTPAFVARPAAVDISAQAPQPDQARPEKHAATVRAERSRRKHETTEARVIYELHRHGIYW
jgi:hypothetical protein